MQWITINWTPEQANYEMYTAHTHTHKKKCKKLLLKQIKINHFTTSSNEYVISNIDTCWEIFLTKLLVYNYISNSCIRMQLLDTFLRYSYC